MTAELEVGIPGTAAFNSPSPGRTRVPAGCPGSDKRSQNRSMKQKRQPNEILIARADVYTFAG